MTRAISWIVRAGDPETLGALVVRAGGDDAAIAEGRVFVGRARAKSADAPVRVGDEVRISVAAAGDRGEAVASQVRVIARAAGLVALEKPAGLPTIADHAGAAHTLVAAAAKLLGVAEEKLHPTSRLDREVSGVVVLASSPAAAALARRARDEGAYARLYVAVGSTTLEGAPDEGVWDAPIGRHPRDARHRAANGKDPAPARTRFRIVARAGGACLLALRPETGRTHQLRVHAAHAGAPLVGDRVYGGRARVTSPSGAVVPFDRIALHAARVVVGRLDARADVPEALRTLWAALGGVAPAWDTALSWETDS